MMVLEQTERGDKYLKVRADKTKLLEKALERAESLYIEGAAASGKTTAVRMLVSKHPETACAWFDLSIEKDETVFKELSLLYAGFEGWIVVDSLECCRGLELIEYISDCIYRDRFKGRFLLISREKPAKPLARLLWSEKLAIVPQEFLRFSLEDIRDLAEGMDLQISPYELYRETDGWPGCTVLMLKMLSAFKDLPVRKRGGGGEEYADIRTGRNVKPMFFVRFGILRQRYEIKEYIDKELLGALSSGERKIMDCAGACPWVTADFCRECLDAKTAEETVSDLWRKGMLLRSDSGVYRAAALFQTDGPGKEDFPWLLYGKWYRDRGYDREAYYCYERSGDRDRLLEFAFARYKYIPYVVDDYSFILGYEGDSLCLIYLRGMYFYQKQRFEEFRKELDRARKLEGRAGKEVYLNLLYAAPSVSVTDWLEKAGEIHAALNEGSFELFNPVGGGYRCLCGIRDLSPLFACRKQEENRYARIWKTVFGKKENLFYTAARVEYYIDTGQAGKIREDEISLLIGAPVWKIFPGRLLVNRMYLFCRLFFVASSEVEEDMIRETREDLLKSYSREAGLLGDAIYNLFLYYRGKPEYLACWLRENSSLFGRGINEDNYMLAFARAKGLILLRQYEKAGSLVRRLTEYLQGYRRDGLMAELMFQQAIIHYQMNEKGLSLRSMIESFAIGGKYRYLLMYSGYRESGNSVLMQYADWYNNQNAEKMQRKRRYDYRSVLNMSVPEYLDALLKMGRKRSPLKDSSAFDGTERLTMTETVVLQSLAGGLTNEQISAALNLKVTTVKSHLYSVYKKLNVKNRTEAIIKAKELRIIT